jgi:hypothetical protein
VRAMDAVRAMAEGTGCADARVGVVIGFWRAKFGGGGGGAS